MENTRKFAAGRSLSANAAINRIMAQKWTMWKEPGKSGYRPMHWSYIGSMSFRTIMEKANMGFLYEAVITKNFRKRKTWKPKK